MFAKYYSSLVMYSLLVSYFLLQGLRRVPPEVAALTQLRTLALTCCPLSEGDGGVAHLLPLTRLTELSITVSSLAEELPAPLLCLPQLEVSQYLVSLLVSRPLLWSAMQSGTRTQSAYSFPNGLHGMVHAPACM